MALDKMFKAIEEEFGKEREETLSRSQAEAERINFEVEMSVYIRV